MFGPFLSKTYQNLPKERCAVEYLRDTFQYICPQGEGLQLSYKRHGPRKYDNVHAFDRGIHGGLRVFVSSQEAKTGRWHVGFAAGGDVGQTTPTLSELAPLETVPGREAQNFSLHHLLFLRLCLGLFVLANQPNRGAEPIQSHFAAETLGKTAIHRDAFSIFNAVHHLGRTWPSTFTPNGFSCVQATIPARTNLYHARNYSTIPAAPEWLAFDHEMSLSVMEVFYDSPDVFLRTYRTTRDLNMLLLDGSSAFLSTTGSVDFQFVLLDGQVGNHTIEEIRATEYMRAERLCAWGVKFGLDGFLRQQLGFEIIKCGNFEDGLQLIGNINVGPWSTHFPRFPWGGRNKIKPHPTPTDLPGVLSPPVTHFSLSKRPTDHPTHLESPFLSATVFEWMRLVGRDDTGALEETRLRLDTSSFVTAYGREDSGHLYRSSPLAHRLINLTSAGARDIKAEVERHLISSQNLRSPIIALSRFGRPALVQLPSSPGIDWRARTDLMIQRYARRIADLHDSLERSTEFVGTANSTSNPLDNPLITSRMMIANLLSPHFDLSTDLDDSSAMNRVVDACTAFSAIEIFDGISGSELKIVTAIEHVERSICQTIFLAHRELKIPEVETDITLDRMWQRRAHRALRLVSSLMQHLKWTAWKTCEQKCGTGEVCHTSNWIEDDEQEVEDGVTVVRPPACVSVSTFRWTAPKMEDNVQTRRKDTMSVDNPE